MQKKEFRPLTIPRLMWNKDTLTGVFGELVAQPLEPGFGATLGNALRRTLLGAVEGSAVTSVIIKGVNHEFTALAGVTEDVMQVILNIKELVIKNSTGKPGTMRLQAGPGTATAAQIVADEHLEVINKDHVIAQVSAGGTLDIEFFVETGREYRPAQWPLGQGLQPDNRIYVDATFSPVRKVTHHVEKTRVGKDIDYDKLIMHITTDGTETPQDVLHYAVSVLRTQLEHFLVVPEIPFNAISAVHTENGAGADKVTEAVVKTIKGIPADLLLKPIDVLEFSVRAHNCLINAGIKRIIDLVNLSEDDVLKIKNFGKKSYDEVKENMKNFNLSFSMHINEADVIKLLEHE